MLDCIPLYTEYSLKCTSVVDKETSVVIIDLNLAMERTFLCIFFVFSSTGNLNGNKQLLLTVPQYVQNIVHTFEVKRKQMNQKLTHQDDRIVMFKKTQDNSTQRLTIQESHNHQLLLQLNNATQQLESQEKLNQHLINQFNNETQRLEYHENNYDHTLEKLEAQDAINHIVLSRLSTQESLNNKLAQDLDNKTKELDEHLILQNER